jgi:acyl transferase domain-containing protein
MGRELYDTQPVFRESIDRCAALLDGQLEAPLLALLGYTEEAAEHHIDRTENTQPAPLRARVCAGAALAQLGYRAGAPASATAWASWPQPAWPGFSAWRMGSTLVAACGRLMGALPQDGEMVSLLAAEVQGAGGDCPLRGRSCRLQPSTARPAWCISGSRDAVLAVSESLAAEGVKSQRLTVSHAFHSPLMEPMLEAFRQVAERIVYHKPVLRLVSNVTGQLAGDEIATPGVLGAPRA